MKSFSINKEDVKNFAKVHEDATTEIRDYMKKIHQALNTASRFANMANSSYEYSHEIEDEIGEVDCYIDDFSDFSGLVADYKETVDSNFDTEQQSITNELSEIKLENIRVTQSSSLKSCNEDDEELSTKFTSMNIQELLNYDDVDKALRIDFETQKKQLLVLVKI